MCHAVRPSQRNVLLVVSPTCSGAMATSPTSYQAAQFKCPRNETCGLEKHTFVVATSGTAAAAGTTSSAAVFVRRHSDSQLSESISELRTAYVFWR